MASDTCTSGDIRSNLAFMVETARPEADFEGDVLRGLSSSPPSIPPKYFYDEAGAALFEAICDTPEYYVTKAELALLKDSSCEIAELVGPNASLFEPGSGAADKVRILLRVLDTPAEYALFDISQEQMERVAGDINGEFPSVRVGAIAGDFTQPFPVTGDMFHGDGKRVCYFPGSTLGNFTPRAQERLLKTFKAPLRRGDGLLLGVDAVKDAAILDAAYNDGDGLTATFNRNLLARMERDLKADLTLADWEHNAFFEPVPGRIRMFLTARRNTSISVGNRTFEFAAGDSIHTEDSWKFDASRLRTLARATGFRLDRLWSDPRGTFLLAWMTVR